PATLAQIRATTLRICAKKGYAASTLAVLPDHLHLAIRGALTQSPEEIALAFLNNLAYVLGQRPWWEAGYYAGTFGEYSMAALSPKGGKEGRKRPNYFPCWASRQGSRRKEGGAGG